MPEAKPESDPQHSSPAWSAGARAVLWLIAILSVLIALCSSHAMYARMQAEEAERTTTSTNGHEPRTVRAFLNLHQPGDKSPYQSLPIPSDREGVEPLCERGQKRGQDGSCKLSQPHANDGKKSIEMVFIAPRVDEASMYLRSKATDGGNVYDYSVPCEDPYLRCLLIDDHVEAIIVRYTLAPTRLVWWVSLAVVACLLVLLWAAEPRSIGDARSPSFGIPVALSMLLGVRFFIAINATIGAPEFAPHIVLTGLELLLLPAACWILMGRIAAHRLKILVCIHALGMLALWWAVSGDFEASDGNLIRHLFMMKIWTSVDQGSDGLLSNAFALELIATAVIYGFAIFFRYRTCVRALFDAQRWYPLRWFVLLCPFVLAIVSMLASDDADARQFHWFAFASLGAIVFFCVARSFFSSQAAGISLSERCRLHSFAFYFLGAMIFIAVIVTTVFNNSDMGALLLAVIVTALVVYPVMFAGRTLPAMPSFGARSLHGVAILGFFVASLGMLVMPGLKLLSLRDLASQVDAQLKAQQAPSIEKAMNGLDGPKLYGLTDWLNPCRVVPGIGDRSETSAVNAGPSNADQRTSSLSAKDIEALDDCFYSKHLHSPANSKPNQYKEKGHEFTRFYAWLVGHPYDRIWGVDNLSKLQGYQQAIANTVPDEDEWFSGDRDLPSSRALGPRSPKDGFNYEWLVGLQWLRPFGIAGAALILIAYGLLYVSIAPANLMARSYAAVMGIASLWLLLQTQGAFVMIGQSTPLLTFTSFVGDFIVCLCPLLILLCIPPVLPVEETR